MKKKEDKSSLLVVIMILIACAIAGLFTEWWVAVAASCILLGPLVLLVLFNWIMRKKAPFDRALRQFDSFIDFVASWLRF